MPRLRRTSPDQKGWSRRRAGSGFTFLDEDGQRLGPEERQRCLDLVIPPAWQDVWITPFPNGHLQAVGTDEAGRPGHDLDHPDWRTKPRRREVPPDATWARRCRGCASGCSPTREARGCRWSVLARSPYASWTSATSGSATTSMPTTNGSFGLTTMRKDHVSKRGGKLVFCFVGKSGVEHSIEIDDEAVITVLEVMRRRRGGGEELLAFKEGSTWRDIDSSHVNDYVREVSGMEASAKDFRTWHATVLGALALAETEEPGATQASRKRAVAGAMREVSEFLGNTPALARSAYVDPRVVKAYESGRTIASGRRSFTTRGRAAGRAGARDAEAVAGELSQSRPTTWSMAPG